MRKSTDEVAKMRRAGRVVAEMLERCSEAARPGTTTADLDQVARQVLDKRGARSNFLNYHGYPAVICTSPNNVIVHGIPGDYRLKEGDIVSIDCGAIVGGYHGDSAVTVCVGDVPEDVRRLVAATEEALRRGLDAVRDGARVCDIGIAVEEYVRPLGYGIVTDYTGHGIGRALHEDPNVPNVAPRRSGRGPRIEPGLVLAIEPMLTLGSAQVRLLDDDWTVVTEDGSWAAHFEHTIALTDDGPEVLTAP